jgi:hypothetical protein
MGVDRLRRRLAAMLVVAVVPGCEKASVRGPAGKRLTLYKPADQTLVRGENNQVAIVISRENFGSSVKIRFENLPKGVTVVEKKDIASDVDRAVFTLHASPNADLVSNNEVRVIAEGPEGLAVTERFLLTVKDRGAAKPKETGRGTDSPY